MSRVIDRRSRALGGASKRAVSRINKVARHHSATTQGNGDSFDRYWRSIPWRTGGYHEIILRNGDVELCYDPDVVTNGIQGHNQTTYHICVVGNGNFTAAQERTFQQRAKRAVDRFGLTYDDVLGHREFSGANTACPGINMNTVRRALKAGHPVGQPSGGSSNSGGSGSTPRYGPNNQSFSDYHSGWWGDEGEHIKAIQRLLQLAKELPLRTADGKFGQQTLNAVRSFQDKHNLSSAGQNFYGVPGPKTLEKLAEVANTTAGLPGDRVRVKASRVNYRSRANWADSAVAGSASRGEVFTITRRAIMSNGSDLYRLESGNFISVHPNFVEILKQ